MAEQVRNHIREGIQKKTGLTSLNIDDIKENLNLKDKMTDLTNVVNGQRENVTQMLDDFVDKKMIIDC